MRILISNDDGHEAEGLKVLHRALCDLAECDVVVPNTNRSAISNALTVRRPLQVSRLDNGFITVDGTPADCVHLATGGLLRQMPDMVVSGINAGMNMGDDVLYSGTIAAAVEGRFLERPSLAFSMSSHEPEHYATGGVVARDLISKLQRQSLPPDTILNVNIPDIPVAELKGIRATRLGRRRKSLDAIESPDLLGTHYWLGPPGPVDDDRPGTDFHAVANGYISVTPLHIDMTQHRSLSGIASWLESSA